MYVAMIAVSAFALFPVYYVVVTSLKTRGEIYSRTPDLWPNHPQWHEYRFVLGAGGVGRALLNSLIVAVLVVFSTIWDFKIFDQIYVMAAGVPDRAADTAAVAAYREGFALSHYGLGSAVAVVLFLILLACSLLYVRLIGREGEL